MMVVLMQILVLPGSAMRAAPAFGQAPTSCSTVGAKLEEVQPTLPPCFNALRHPPRLLHAVRRKLQPAHPSFSPFLGWGNAEGLAKRPPPGGEPGASARVQAGSKEQPQHRRASTQPRRPSSRRGGPRAAAPAVMPSPRRGGQRTAERREGRRPEPPSPRRGGRGPPSPRRGGRGLATGHSRARRLARALAKRKTPRYLTASAAEGGRGRKQRA